MSFVILFLDQISFFLLMLSSPYVAVSIVSTKKNVTHKNITNNTRPKIEP